MSMAMKQTTAFEETLPAYVLSQEVEDVAREVIADNTGFRDLSDVRIAFALRTDAPTADEDGIDDVVGVVKASPLWSCLSDYDVVVHVKDDYWRRHQGEHAALLTHGLSHLLVTEEGKIKKVGHDVEAFHREAVKFGAWRPNLSRFWTAMNVDRGDAPTPDPDRVADLATHARKAREGRAD
jgi:hypothetical protein